MFLRKDVPEICCKFTGWHPCRSSAISIKLLFICFIRHITQASLAKYLSVRLRTQWLWVRIPLLSPKLQIWLLLRARSSLTFRQTIECGFTLKLVPDMIITYSNFYITIWHPLLNNLLIYFLNLFISLIHLKTFLYLITYLFLFFIYLFL